MVSSPWSFLVVMILRLRIGFVYSLGHRTFRPQLYYRDGTTILDQPIKPARPLNLVAHDYIVVMILERCKKSWLSRVAHASFFSLQQSLWLSKLNWAEEGIFEYEDEEIRVDKNEDNEDIGGQTVKTAWIGVSKIVGL